jgi:hypothetical protein
MNSTKVFYIEVLQRSVYAELAHDRPGFRSSESELGVGVGLVPTYDLINCLNFVFVIFARLRFEPLISAQLLTSILL